MFSCGRPVCRVLPLPREPLEIGRDELAAAGVPDAKVSARHVRVTREDGRFSLRDLDSKNGTFVDGRQVQAARQLTAPVVRIGRTILLLVDDCRALAEAGVEAADGVVRGPRLRAVHDRAAAIAGSGAGLLVVGESGSGKELCAAAFHAAGGAGGPRAGRPFVAVNCATIPRELAERTLFGAQRGAYTGAVADAEGLVQAAHGGTLFLDEIAELEPSVQAKLLRVLETKEVTPMGGVKPTVVDVRVCAATHKILRAEVNAGRFREDLYFRVGRPELRVPPLRERREEIPFLVDRALAALPGGAKPAASAELVEACLLRPWPGNVRELLAEVTSASVVAATAGRAVVAAADHSEDAGEALDAGAAADDDAPGEPAGAPLPEPGAALEGALRAERGNITRAATRLGLSRSRLRRFIERAGIDLSALRGQDDER